MKPEDLVIGEHYVYTIPSTDYFISKLGESYDTPNFQNPHVGLEFVCVYSSKTHSSNINLPANIEHLEGNYYEFNILKFPIESTRHFHKFTLPELFVRDWVDPFISNVEHITDLYLI
jgi:hypothetical protein